MDTKLKKIIIGGVICLFGIFLILSAPIWTVQYFEIMLATAAIGVAVIVIGLGAMVYGLIKSSDKNNKIIK